MNRLGGNQTAGQGKKGLEEQEWESKIVKVKKLERERRKEIEKM